MRIAFMASDPIALEAIGFLKDTSRLACVVSNPDKPKGRGKKLSPNCVSEWAMQNGVELLRPEHGPDEPTVNRLRELDVDAIIVMAYGCMLRDNILKFSEKYPCLNLHASILPQLRGASPVESAIALGLAETGVSLMRVEKRMDAGAVCACIKTPISCDETSASLRGKIAKLSARLLADNIGAIENVTLDFVPQDEFRATYVRKLSKEDMRLDFSKSAAELERRIRAFGFGIFEFGAEPFKIGSAKAENADWENADFGTVAESSQESGLLIKCASGFLRAETIQRPCAKMMSAREFFSGFSFPSGTRFESFSNAPLLK